MGNLAVTADALSKRYWLGERKVRHNTLRDQAMHRLKSLANWREKRAEAPTSFWALKGVSFERKG